jgi:predicted cytidylate kinase
MSEGDGAQVRHITISGDLGSGKSSVAQELAGRSGYAQVSTGAIQREIAAGLSLSTLEANTLAESDTSIDDRIDGVTQAMAAAATAPVIFDSRMAWHFVPGSLRVRLTVDPMVAARRVLRRGPGPVESYESLDHTFDGLLARAASEVRRFQARYGVDIARLANFDLVVDTSGLSVGAVADLIAEAHAAPDGGHGAGLEESQATRVLVCPRAIVPAFGLAGGRPRPSNGTVPPGGDTVPVIYARPFFLAVGGAATLSAAITAGTGVIAVCLEADEAGPNPTLALADLAVSEGLTDWEQEFGLDFHGLRRFLRSGPGAG